jgi:hypothetical protein
MYVIRLASLEGAFQWRKASFLECIKELDNCDNVRIP